MAQHIESETSMSIDKIIERIQKLNKLATSSNVNEAAAAAAMAQRLMTEHRISEAQLSAEHDEADAPITDMDVLAASGNKRPQTWLVWLATGAARANGCRIVIWNSSHGGRKGAIKLYGRQQDIDAARYIFLMLKNEIDRLGKAANYKDRGATHSFKLGAAIEIAARLTETKDTMQKQLKAAVDFGNLRAGGALTVINKTEDRVKARVEEILGGSSRHFHGSGPSQFSAYNAGREAGRGVNLGGGSRGALPSSPKQIN